MPGFVVYIKRHLPSAPFFESHSHRRSRLSVSERTQPSITRSARLIPLQRAARCKSPPGCSLQKPTGLFAYRSRGLETFVFFPRQILRTPRFCLRTKSLRSLCKISSSKSQKTPACCAPNPTGAMNVREQAVPRPKVSAFRPKNNIIGPKLCNRLPPSSLA